MKSLGADLSLTGTGIVVLDDGKLVMQDSIKSKKDGDKPSDEIARLRGIVKRVMAFVDEHNPEVVVLEGIAFMSRNTTSLAQLAGLNYMMRDSLVDRGIDFLVVAPTSLKKYVTGAGNSSKDIMMLETYKRFGVSILDNNICDAYGLAQAGLAATDEDYKTTKFQDEVISLLRKQQ